MVFEKEDERPPYDSVSNEQGGHCDVLGAGQESFCQDRSHSPLKLDFSKIDVAPRTFSGAVDAEDKRLRDDNCVSCK